jgi:hypothetical protein
MSNSRFSEILIKIKAGSRTTAYLSKTELRESIDLICSIVVGIVILIVIMLIFLIYIYIRMKNIKRACAMQSNGDLNFLIKLCKIIF